MSKKWRCRRHCCHSIVAGTTAVVPARFVTHLRVANRLRRLCPLGTRFPTVPAGVLGAESLSLMPQHSSREPAKRCSRAHAFDQGFFDSLIAASEEIQERRFLYGMKFGQMTAKGMAVRAALIVCPAGSPLPVTVYANFAVKARDKGCGFHGYLASFGASAGAYPLPR